MMSITTNTAALTAQRHLHDSGAAASSSIAKMSSGSRIVKPSDDAASLAISNKLTSNIGSLEQAARNASQGASLLQVASGALDRISDMLSRMKVLSAQVNNDALSSTERLFAQEEFTNLRTQITNTATQTRWNGLSLLTGGGGAVTVDSAAAAVAEGATGLTAVANAFAGTLNAASQGFISGIATDAQVTANGGLYDVTVTVGNQTFKATTAATAGGTLDLVSTTDSRNVISLDYDAAVTAITDAATFESTLRQALGVDTAAKANFTSSSIDLSAAVNGLANNAITAGAGTAAGTYALEYTAASNTFTLTSGDRVWTQTVSADGAQTVTFDNGVSVSLAAGFAANTDIGQVTFDVAEGTNVSMVFQVAERATDTVTVNFVAATASALNLTGLTLATVADAAAAGTVLDAAINTVNTSQADLGAIMSRFEHIQSTLATQVENLTAARATFHDVDMAKEMTEFTKNQTLMQAGIAMLGQANQMPQLMMRLIQ